jgi:hypothetical protein
VIPKPLLLIEEGIWSRCSSLTTKTTPNSVVSLGSYCFFGCIPLQNVSIEIQNQTIFENTFATAQFGKRHCHETMSFNFFICYENVTN